jgi:2'-5' RNA ligase
VEQFRAFLAFEVSDASKKWVENKKQEIMKKFKGTVRWAKRDNMHVTLHFFDKIAEKTIHSLNFPLRTLAEKSQPFHLKINSLGAFPNRNNPRVIWAGLKYVDEKDTLGMFYAGLCNLIKEAGLPAGKRPYRPHITLGRVKKKHPLRLPESLFADRPGCSPFWVREVVFYRSELTPKGPIYQALNRFPLGGKDYD